MKSLRRLLLCLLTLTLCLPSAGVLAEEPSVGLIYQGMLDRIAFALPGGGRSIYESDEPGIFEDVRQIYGWGEEGEFTLRTADISGWIAGMQEYYPDEELYHIRANTLIQFAAMMPMTYGAQPADMRAHDGGDYVSASFTFIYPDEPEVPCEGFAYLNTATGRAVALYGSSGENPGWCREALRFVEESEQEAWLNREPETVSLGRLKATFPVPPVDQQGGKNRVTGCLTDRFEYLAVQTFADTTLAVPEDDEEARSLLEGAARKEILPTIPDTEILSSTLTRPAEGVAVLTFDAQDPQFGAFGTRYRCALCVTPDAVYYIWSTDTETGRAFLDSLDWEAPAGEAAPEA
ncbi:MAG: hypothetical protein IKP40_02800 [Clostridia bacterium]|nr:hypothetical protein [Clostridia bacterium]